MRFAYRKAADCITGKAYIHQATSAEPAHLSDIASLHDAEKHVAGRRGFKSALASLRPSQRKLHCPLDVPARGGQSDAFIHLHGNVGAEQELYLDRAFGRQLDLCAVDMGAESDGFFTHLAEFGQRHHLKAAGVREHRSVPTCKLLQTSERCDALRPWPQHEMIGVAEHYIGAGVAHFAPMHALHGACGPHRHESRCSHHAMRRRQPAGARSAVGRHKIKMIGRAHDRLLRDNGPGFNLVEANPVCELAPKYADGG